MEDSSYKNLMLRLIILLPTTITMKLASPVAMSGYITSMTTGQESILVKDICMKVDPLQQMQLSTGATITYASFVGR